MASSRAPSLVRGSPLFLPRELRAQFVTRRKVAHRHAITCDEVMARSKEQTSGDSAEPDMQDSSFRLDERTPSHPVGGHSHDRAGQEDKDWYGAIR